MTNWMTKSWPFRLLCTGIGMVTENGHRHRNNFEAKPQTHNEYVRKLAPQLATVSELKLKDGSVLKKADRTVKTRPSPQMQKRAASPTCTPGGPSIAAGVPVGSFDGKSHSLGPTLLGAKRRCQWCQWVHGKESRITTRCVECDTALCSPARTGEQSEGGRRCFEMHKLHGLPPSRQWKTKASESGKRKWATIAVSDVNHLQKSKALEGQEVESPSA